MRHRIEPLREGLFVSPRSGTTVDRTYLGARPKMLSAKAATSPKLPHALRHAAVSTWLSAGVPPAQVAEWAGHSVAVLLKLYAKCIAGQEEDAKRRIAEATKPRAASGDTR
ncbi:MAG: hypothetical protein BUE48_021485 [Thermomonospora sp. CIF 1]|nr:MAG: hypothetical protein BUE48_021485 [Thermomonospora sp. CIF 1]